MIPLLLVLTAGLAWWVLLWAYDVQWERQDALEHQAEVVVIPYPRTEQY